MAKAYLVVRAVVTDPSDRARFDQWYRTEHLPDAIKAFSATGAWRGWSSLDPSVHTAYYEFESLDAVRAVAEGPTIKPLIAEFDRCWGTRVTRTREIVEVADELRA